MVSLRSLLSRSLRFAFFVACMVGALAVVAGVSVPAAAQQQPPATLIGVHLVTPDFMVFDLKYRVFYNKSERKTIPLKDYDFARALTDELANALSDDKTAFRAPTAEESLFLASYFDPKGKKIQFKKTEGSLPPSVKADRLLLVSVMQYGAMRMDLGPDKFDIQATLWLLDRNTGQQLWKKGMFERIPLTGKLDALQADNQKGLKQGLNDVLEKFARRAKEKMGER